jgi:hypothetical protein
MPFLMSQCEEGFSGISEVETTIWQDYIYSYRYVDIKTTVKD